MTKVKVTVTKQSKKEPKSETFELDDSTTVADLKARIADKFRVAVERQGLKIELEEKGKDGKPVTVRLDDDRKTLEAVSKKAGGAKLWENAVQLKDQGPQFSYRGVFFWEYFGPMVIVPLFTLQPVRELVYPLLETVDASKPVSPLVQAAAVAWGLHYLKRELETFFVHKFSRSTMPLSNLFKNCGYYWTFAALNAYVLSHPNYTAPSQEQVYAGLGAMAFFEAINLYIHLWFSWQRSGDGDSGRQVPWSHLFSIVSCPNYTSEVFSWVSFSLATNLPVAWLFTAVGFLQMTEWAIKKHKDYIEKDPSVKKRAAIIPFLL